MTKKEFEIKDWDDFRDGDVVIQQGPNMPFLVEREVSDLPEVDYVTVTKLLSGQTIIVLGQELTVENVITHGSEDVYLNILGEDAPLLYKSWNSVWRKNH